MRNFMSRKMKIFLSILAIISLTSYISAAIVLYNSDFKLSNYINKWNDDFNFSWHNYRNIGSLEKELSSDIKTIDITTSSVDVKIQFYDGDVLKLDGTSYTLGDITISNIVTDISSLNNTFTINLNTNGYNDININIYVPLSYKNNIKVSSISGDCEVTGGDLESVTINSNSGEIQLKNLTSKILKLQTTSNDLDLSDIKSLDSTLNTTSGDIKVSVSSLGELFSSTSSGETELYLNNLGNKSIISSTSGDIDLFINESIGYTLAFSTSSGNIDSDRLMPNFLNDNNYSVTNGDGSKKVEVKTTSGEFYIR
ncbi:MAG: DUF4097 family beta strand repeat protein [Clostridium sp.]|uniref:DUF4097 domain-containing protein n=1 Tax=Clostridium paraputrificum TaxID=29363 RepID=A0A6N3BDM4_9CLOT|nr:DUF4097 family beta strand repeat-containing protein [Clostridium sp.]MBS5926620.1 DUF4097 family beta strand repeat protein [Clostridium sp.]MBS5988048.1 DUF4097 family beta strand repeat protein [Clostridium sp.]